MPSEELTLCGTDAAATKEDQAMANADKKHHGPGVQGKGDGTGGMTNADATEIPANSVLSNRDKSLHSQERGLDSAHVQTQQYKDHVGARLVNPQPSEDLPDQPDRKRDRDATGQLDRDGEGSHARISDIVKDQE
jgi:hypothetical protein